MRLMICLAEVRSKESEKSLAAQRLQYLKERETSLNDFLQKAGGQLKGLDESIQFTSVQISEDEVKLEELEGRLDELKNAVEEKRKVFDEKRSSIDELRRENQAIQRNQFDAEKKVAVADTSIQNLQRTIAQIQEEKAQRQGTVAAIGSGEKSERRRTGAKENRPAAITGSPRIYKGTDISNAEHAGRPA